MNQSATTWLRLAMGLWFVAWAAGASAEPYLAGQTGLKCVQCHANPTGGGLRNVFGNTFAQTQLAAKRLGPAEDLWTGQVMKYLAVGGNARANWNFTEVPDVGSSNDFAVEEARAYLDFGVIPNRLSVYLDQRFAPGNSTNLEANVRYWVTENELYVKAGRMYLPFGYRFEDDDSFVRSLSGINMQAPDEGFELGFEKGSWSTQLAISNGTGGAPEGDEGKQVSARTEFVQSAWRVGVSALSNHTDAGDRIGAGLFGAWRTGPIVLLGELDWFDDDSIGAEGRQQLATLVEADWRVAQGHNLKLAYEWFEPNEDVDEDEQSRSSILYEWAPIQFVQVRAGVRIYDGIPQSDPQNRKQFFLQLHGFF
jgi:hypothetical protein